MESGYDTEQYEFPLGPKSAHMQSFEQLKLQAQNRNSHSKFIGPSHRESDMESGYDTEQYEFPPKSKYMQTYNQLKLQTIMQEQVLSAGDISPLKETLLTPSIEPVDLPESHPKFIDPVEVVHCDASGGVYYNPIHGVTLRIPEGAVPPGMELEISIGVCLYGNFSFPEGLSPVSAIVWLCTQNRSDFHFLKPVEVIVPHFLDCQSAEDAKSLEICFLKTSHQPTAAEGFQFLPSDGLMDFTSLAGRGILHTRHFCYDCIAANISDDQLKKERFSITCAVPHPIASWSTMYFYVTYDIPTCCDVSFNIRVYTSIA